MNRTELVPCLSLRYRLHQQVQAPWFQHRTRHIPGPQKRRPLRLYQPYDYPLNGLFIALDFKDNVNEKLMNCPLKPKEPTRIRFLSQTGQKKRGGYLPRAFEIKNLLVGYLAAPNIKEVAKPATAAETANHRNGIGSQAPPLTRVIRTLPTSAATKNMMTMFNEPLALFTILSNISISPLNYWPANMLLLQ